MAKLTITAAKVALNDGRHYPYAQINGAWWLIETKPELLVMGIAAVIPVQENLAAYWERAHRFTAIVPADPANGRHEDRRMVDAAADARLVALSANFNNLAAAGQLTEGPLTALRRQHNMPPTGKLSRLPAEMREQVFKRIYDGQPYRMILKWLNGNAKVRRILKESMPGFPPRITNSNLSDFRARYFGQWLADRDAAKA